MYKLLFLCTGNYYRSRFAELLFNAMAAPKELPPGSQAFLDEGEERLGKGEERFGRGCRR